jgi:hypothetical protein
MKIHSILLNKITVAFLFLVGLSIAKIGNAQYDQTIYNLPTVIQKNQANPAFIPKMKYHFGVPGLSSMYAGFGNSGFSYSQVFTRRGDDSLIFNSTELLNALGTKNNFHVNVSEQWLNAGYKWNEYYFSLSVSDIVDVNLNYPKELVQFAVKGNGDYIGKTADFGGTSLRYLHYREYAFGAAMEVDKKLNVGAKVKFLFGKSGINTKNLDAKITTTENTFALTTESNILINSSMPKSWYDGGGEDVSNKKYLFYTGNFGLAFDMGASYKYDSKISFSASVIDLGYIQFERFTKNFANDNVTWTFEGIDLWNFEGIDSTEVDNKITAIGDSLMDKFKLTTESSKFKTMLTAKIYLAGNYKLSQKEDLGIVLRSEIYDKVWRPAFTASYSYKVNDKFAAMASYTIASRAYFNIGLGMVYNWAPIQVYLTTDNFVGIFVPDLVRTTNIHFGVNIIFPEKSSGRSLID